MKYSSKYLVQMAVSFIGYIVGLFALNYFYPGHSPYRFWLVLLPIIPLMYMATVIIRAVSGMDELWRKVVAEAMGFAAIATGFTCFSYLFLRDMGAPEFHAEWAFYLMWIYYGIGTFFSWRRYR